MADAKSLTDQVEHYEPEDLKFQQDGEVPSPASRRGLFDEGVEKLGVKASRKLDLIVMPALTIIYILNYLTASKLANIIEDLNLSVTEYNALHQRTFRWLQYAIIRSGD
ncbi:Hypothetical predicted protein [Lecanosticta acicola]|uniref:Uncharacterized protein n=1 Tax=Lecanosticta acicola TaxID=111012 RepID=A0AAI8YZ16_9PEZI|nr:Hypothetical predicted protein [Lecanosticta acicola]